MSGTFDEVFTESGPHRGAWLCYINGLEVPIVGWQVEYGVWQIPTATIHLFPERCVERIGAEDRVQVALFYLDHWAGPHSEFRLMFDGEVIGWSYQHSHGQRTIALSCQAHIQIFQQLFFFYMTTLDDVVAAGTQENLAQGINTAGFFYPYELFHQGLIKDVDEPNKLIERPFDLVYNVVAGLISTRVPTTNRSSPMLNFFSRWVRRTRFHNRWVSLPVLERSDRIARRAGLFPIFRAVRNVEALNAMQRRAADTSNRGPVWDLLQDMLGMVYMEIQMLPTAPCVKADLTTREILGPLLTSDPLVDQTLIARDDRTPRTVTPSSPMATLDSPRLSSSLAQETASTVSATDIYRQALNRVLIAATDADPGFAARTIDRTIEQEYNIENRIANASGSPVELADALAREIQQNNNRLATPVSSAVAALRSEFGTRTASDLAAERTQRNTTEINSAAGNRIATPGEQRPTGDAPTTFGAERRGTPPSQPVTLAQYAVKPQMFFGVAPSCNVLYPSMIESWTYDENYAMQPTRLYVNDALFSSLMNGRTANPQASTFASIALTVGYPEEADAVLNAVRTQTPTTGERRQSGKNVLLWAEEFFKGPVTARATLPQWFQMLTQLRNTSATSEAAPAATTPNATQASAQVSSGAEPRTRARTWGGRAVTRWNNDIGAAIRDISRRQGLFPNTPPEFFVGVTASLGRGQYAERTGAGITSAMGLFDLEVKNEQTQNRLGDVWMRLRDSATVRSILGRAASDDFATVFSPAGVRDEIAVSLTHWRRDYDGVIQRQVAGTGVQVQEGTLLYAALLKTAHGAGGVIRDLLTSDPNVLRAAIAANGTPHQWRDILRAYASGGNDGSIIATRPGGRYRNRFHVLLRALQEIEIGRHLANNPGAAGPSSPTAAAFFNPGFSSPEEETAVYSTITRLGYAPYRSQRVPLGQDGRPVQTTPPVVPTPQDDEFDTTEQTPTEEVAATEAGPSPAQPHATSTLPPRPITDSSTGQDVGDVHDEGIVGATEYQRLFRVYAQYEFLRQRYDKRRGGAQLAFNPYVVPGYPMHLFDRMTTEHHIVGYLMTVQQSGFVSNGTQANLNTSVTYSFGRTIGEFLADVRRDSIRFNEAVASAPAEVIDEIRTVIQDAVEADSFYNKLLYADGAANRASFRFVSRHGLTPLYSTSDQHGRAIPIEIAGANSPNENMRLVERAEDDRAEAEAERIQGGVVTDNLENERAIGRDTAPRPAPTTPTVPRTRLVADPNGGVIEVPVADTPTSGSNTVDASVPETASDSSVDASVTQDEIDAHNVNAARRQQHNDEAALLRARPAQPRFDGTKRIVPSASELACFENYDTAMKRVARPICTLAEYIRFWHGGRPIVDLERAHVIERGEDDFSFAVVNDRSYTGNNLAGANSAARDRRETARGTAAYWKRIYAFKQGSASMQPPDASVLRSTQVPGEYRWTVETGDVGTLPSNFPETRDNWDKWLVKYRDIIRYKLSPQR